MQIIQHHPVIEQLFSHWREPLGKDFTAYRNHVYRVLNHCNALRPLNPRELDQVAIAAAFHDVGIWLDHTFDYLAPSVRHANNYLVREGKSHWIEAVRGMIEQHHKITTYHGPHADLVDLFRQADWIDVSMGAMRFGLSFNAVRLIRKALPYAGFHWRLVELSAAHITRHPLRPLPMFRW